MNTFSKGMLIIFLLMWFSTLAVEVYDIYWSIKLHDTLYEMEMNPIGKWLIQLNDGSPALFMCLKVFFVTIILTVLPLIFQAKKEILAVLMLLPLFLSRVCLFAYMITGPWWNIQ